VPLRSTGAFGIFRVLASAGGPGGAYRTRFLSGRCASR